MVRGLIIAFGVFLVGSCIGLDAAVATAQQDFGCSIRVIVEAGGKSGDLSLGDCHVALKGVSLRFPQREQGKVYVVQNRVGVQVAGSTHGSGTKTLVFNFPTPLLPQGKASGGLLTHFFGVEYSPAVPVGGKVTVTMIATSGRAQTLRVTAQRLKCPAGVVCSGA